MKKLIIKYSLLSLLLLGSSGKLPGQELESYLRIAAENNPAVKAAYAEFEAALQQSPQVSDLPDPTLTVGAFGRMMRSDMGEEKAKISLMQMFPWFGTFGAMEEAANLMAEAKFQAYLDIRSQVFFEVKTAYAELFLITNTLSLQEENLQILDTYKELALSGIRSGNAPMVNVVKIDIRRDAAATEVELLEDRLQPLKVDFNLLLNRSPEEEVTVVDTLEFSLVNSPTMRNNLNEHPSVQKLEKQRLAYVKQQEVAEKKGMPMLGLGLDYTINAKTSTGMGDMNGQDMYMPMLSVSLPIFRKKYKAARKEAEFMEQAAQHQQVMQKNELSSTYEMTQYELRTAQKLLDLYERQLRNSEQANELLISAFSNSTGNFEEVLDMNQSILLLKLQQLEAMKKGFTAQAKMEYLFVNNSENEQE